VRLTPIRRRVLEVLHGFDKPLGAYDLVDLLSSQGRRMAPITIYRALEFLIDQGLVHRLASRNAYITSSGTSHDRSATAFLICEGCGDVNEITSPDVADTVLKVLQEHLPAPHEDSGDHGTLRRLPGRSLRPAGRFH
jgi:Fur family zinc uptake transcriptional regulator